MGLISVYSLYLTSQPRSRFSAVPQLRDKINLKGFLIVLNFVKYQKGGKFLFFDI